MTRGLSGAIPVALAGIGKIARDQHVPALAGSEAFALAATISRHGTVEGVPAYRTVAEMAAAHPEVRALSVCTPPRGRLTLVREGLAHGLGIMLEKPPAATLGEAEAMVAAAAAAGRTLFATWHSREAAAVAPAQAWLAGRRVARVRVAWKEDVRVWHPGQEWIWEPGIGVFDPGINALSILTRLFPGVLLRSAALRFPEGRAAPIAADLALDADGVPIEVAFDFDQRGPQSWEISIDTDGGALAMYDGGARLFVDGIEQALSGPGEYPGLYRRFAELLASGASDADLAPFRLVADAFLLGSRTVVAPFDWNG